MNDNDHEEPDLPPATAAGFSLDDVFYTLFRHKYIIVTGVVLGLIGAMAVRLVRKPIYESHAEISVPYIAESTGVSPTGGADQIKATDPSGMNILSMEVRILSSLDLATNVAQKVGPSKILAVVGGGNDLMSAAGQIDQGLNVSTPSKAATLMVTFRHPDERVVQPVLAALIDGYRIKSSEIHQGAGAQVDYLLRKREESRIKLDATEEEIKQLKTEYNVLFPEDTRESYKKQIAKVQEELFLAREELADRRAGMERAEEGETNATEAVIAPEQASDYSDLVIRLDELKKFQRKLLGELGYTDQHPEALKAKASIAALTDQKSTLDNEFPQLKWFGKALLRPGTNAPPDLNTELLEEQKLAARVEQLKTSLMDLQQEASQVMELGPKIAALQRQHDDDQKDYQFYSSKLEQVQAGVANGNMTDVRVVQSPTPPALDNRKRMKMMGMAFMGFVGLGLGIAFLIDLVLDRTIKHSSDVKRRLFLPVMLTIPHTNWSGGWCPSWLSRSCSSLIRRSDFKRNGHEPANEAGIAPWNPVHHLRRYTDGLRERLITYFEVHQVMHQPKLVGVTSCGEGVGVTTLATGLAASLSMTGEGNVLLVDMSLNEGAAHSFHKGKPGCGLSETPEDDETPVAGSLAAEFGLASVPANGSAPGPKALPSVFSDVMPQLKLNGYDYIVFDLPPVSQTSMTPRLSSHMDMVLLVIESEKTGRHVAAQSSALMREARANVVTILNKCRQHVPTPLATGY